jgi:8-oxo-dGTP pyrophosphatase MutT (NUDIX family)
MNKNLAHYIAVTVILINNESKYLICKRNKYEKAFPDKWTVPGGKVEVLDYALKEKDTKHHWYNILEEAAKREVKEEVGININEINYLTSMVYVRSDNIPCLIISLYSKCDNEEIVLEKSLTEYSWISLKEAKEYDLIEGIYEELKLLEERLNSEKKTMWSKDQINN